MKRLRQLLMCLGPALCLVAARAQAATAIWSDGFETNGASHWQASSGVWKVGSPTAGPALDNAGYRAHSGTACAYTQGYGYSKDSRLVCDDYNGAADLLVPTNGAPRLRFWQWCNFANALGYVEVSTNGYLWDQVSPTYLNSNGGGVWSRPSIDLSAYAGLHILIAFHFTSGGCCGNGLGWFVDDVEVDTGPEELTFPESFEFDPKTTDWAVDTGTWEIGEPTSGPNKAYSGTNCAGTVLAGNYLNNVDTRLISPPFQVPNTTPATLAFWQWYSFNNALGYVEINNGITNTITVTNTTVTTNGSTSGLNTNIYELVDPGDTNYATPMYWNPTMNGWTNATKILGNVTNLYTIDAGPYTLYPGFTYFEGGNSPLGSDEVTFDYFGTAQDSVSSTNFLQWQGMTWVNITNYDDQPVGYFATNNDDTYVTNTTVTTSTTVWTPISPTIMNATSRGVWTNMEVDLSAYAGQTVQIAFHFTSGGVDTAAGWYVDELTLAAPPDLIVPTNQIIDAGSELMVTNYASDPYEPDATFTFTLLSPPAGVTMTPQGVLTWQTDPDQPSSTNTITVVVKDNAVPPLSATNSFVVIVDNPLVLTVPSTQTIYAGQTLLVTNSAVNNDSPGDSFTFSLLSELLPNMDESDLPVDGVLAWPTLTTQAAGTYTITIGLSDDTQQTSATNSFQVKVLPAPATKLTVPSTQTIYAGQTLMITNIYATNSAFPDNVYTYTFTKSPAGASITTGPNNNGVVTWATTPTNKSVAATFSVESEDGNTPPLTATGTFNVDVSPTPAPSLIVPATLTNYPGQQLSVAIYATNAGRPDATYTFSLPSASTNVCVTNCGTASAMLTWTNTGLKDGILTWTNNSVSPGSKTVYVQVQDDGWLSNPVTNHFAIVFLPPFPPGLLPPTNQVVDAGQTFSDTLVATNRVLADATCTFALLSVSTNAMIQGNLLDWTNTKASPGIYTLPVRLTLSDSVPPILGTNAVSVSVLAQTKMAVPADGGRTLQFNLLTPFATNAAFRIEAATNLAAAKWVPVFTNKTGASTMQFTDRLATNFPDRYYRAVYP